MRRPPGRGARDRGASAPSRPRRAVCPRRAPGCGHGPPPEGPGRVPSGALPSPPPRVARGTWDVKLRWRAPQVGRRSSELGPRERDHEDLVICATSRAGTRRSRGGWRPPTACLRTQGLSDSPRRAARRRCAMRQRGRAGRARGGRRGRGGGRAEVEELPLLRVEDVLPRASRAALSSQTPAPRPR